jgi:hypothetical protein
MDQYDMDQLAQVLAVKAANAMISYNSLEHDIESYDDFASRYRGYICSCRELLLEDIETLSEVKQENYNKLMNLYKTMKRNIGYIHDKANELKLMGIQGALIDRAFNTKVSPILANVIDESKL